VVLVFSALFLSLSISTSTIAESGPLTGVVSDSSGRPIPRAVVQILSRDGAAVGSVFTDADGGFRVAAAPEGCRVQVSLNGFQPAAADCRTDAPMQMTLAVAPIAEDIVVSATRTEAPAGQVGASLTVFDAADIERRQEPQLADLLRQAPGTTIVRTGAPGSVTSLFVRGGESNYTKVLLDGIPINEPGGAFNLSNISTENLDRVEFVRGANSAIYGSDAMTGVLQLFTRRGRSVKPEINLRAEGGTFSTGRGSGAISGRSGRVDYSADVTGYTTNNDAPNNDFDNTTISGSAGASLGHGATLRVIERAELGRTGTPGQTAFGRPDLDAFFKRHDNTWGVTFDQTIGVLHQRATYGLALSHQQSTNLVQDPDYVPSFEGRTSPFAFSDFLFDSRTNLQRHHASYQADGTFSPAHAGTHVDTALVDWDGERATLTDVLNGTEETPTRDNVGVTLQHQALWAQIFVTAGVRFEHNASFGNATVPRVAAAWYLRKGSGDIGSTQLRASAGKSIKEPTLLQSFSPSPFFLGNPDLKPERARTVEVGVEQRLASDRLRLDLAWFDNRYQDIISTQITDFTTFASQFFNVGLTSAKGLELTGDIALVSGLRAGAGYTFLDSEILESTSTSEVFKAGNPAFRRPRHSGFTDIAWSGGRVSLDLTGSFSGRRVDSDFSALVPPIDLNDGYAQWDARASVRVTRVLWVTCAIDNLTDTDRMEPLGYPVLGTAVRVGVRTRW
jgi:vitamin B12 transporter